MVCVLLLVEWMWTREYVSERQRKQLYNEVTFSPTLLHKWIKFIMFMYHKSGGNIIQFFMRKKEKRIVCVNVSPFKIFKFSNKGIH